MYVGHFAAGLALKARVPKSPTWAILLGVGLLDVLFGPFVLAGIEHVHMTPDVSPGFSLDYIDWSHSLAMSLLWGTLYGFAFRKQGLAISLTMGVSVFSHFVLDLFMHPADLALWPGSSVHLGIGIWRLFPTGWWLIEACFIAVCFLYYWSRSRSVATFGEHPFWILVVLLALHVVNSPWLAPT